MVPLRTAFSVTVTGEPVSPGAEPRESEKRLVAPRTLIRAVRKCVGEKFRTRQTRPRSRETENSPDFIQLDK